MEFTDIHCHILPGLDDGARDEEESLAMIRMAVEEGVTRFIATPHYSRQFRNDCPERIREKCHQIEEKARETITKDLEIFPGQEIFWEEEIPEKLDRGEILTLADSSYILMEYRPSVSYRTLLSSLRILRTGGYLPILAHAERYSILRKEGLQELKKSGIYIQMNYASIGRNLFQKDERWCRKQLKEGYIDFLGTDMHNTKSRPPRIQEAMKWLIPHMDEEELAQLSQIRGSRVTANQNI